MMTWMEVSDSYFQLWQHAAARFLDMFKQQPFLMKGWGVPLEQSLQFKRIADQVVDGIWHHFGLPSREDVTRLHERNNLLESRLAELQEQNWAEEVVQTIRRQGNVPTRDDIEPLQKGLKEIEERMAGLYDEKEAISKWEARLGSLADEIEGLEKTVVQFGSRLDALSTKSRKRGGKTPSKDVGEGGTRP